MTVLLLLLALFPHQDEARLRELIRMLDDERIEVREDAERALAKAGEAALPALRAAAASPAASGEQKARAARAIREIEFWVDLRQEYGEPRNVTVKAKAVPLGELLADIGRQTGLAFDASAVRGAPGLSVDVSDAPLLQALDAICLARPVLHLQYQRRGDGSFRFERHGRPDVPAGAAAYSGPFCVRVSKLESVGTPVGAAAGARGHYAEFRVDCDRYPSLAGKFRIELGEVRDDTGALLERRHGRHTATEVSGRGAARVGAGGIPEILPPTDAYQFTFVGAADAAESLAVRGTATVAIPVRRVDVEFDPAAPGQSKDTGDCVISLERMNVGNVVCIRIVRAPSAPAVVDLLELSGRFDGHAVVALDADACEHRAELLGAEAGSLAGYGGYVVVKFPSLPADKGIGRLRLRVGTETWLKRLPFEIRGVALPR